MAKRKKQPDQIVARITGPESHELRCKIMEACKKAGNPLTMQAIYAWKALKFGVPVRRVEVVAKVLGMDKSQIRPDIFSPRA